MNPRNPNPISPRPASASPNRTQRFALPAWKPGRWPLHVAAMALAMSLALPAGSEPHRAYADTLLRPASSVVFVPGALGMLSDAAVLWDAPTQGHAVEMLSAATRVSIGGEARTGGLFFGRRAYWVRAEGPTGVKHGFVEAGTVVVTAGTVSPLDWKGVTADAWTHPAAASDGADSGASVSGTAAAVASAPAAVVASADPLTVAFADNSPAARAAAGSVARAAMPGTGPLVTISWLPDTVVAWRATIEAAAARHGVDGDLIAILILVESGGNPDALSPSGARGLMQVMPGTGRDIATRRGVRGFTTDDLNDPELNIDFGAWYIAEQLRAFGPAQDVDWQRGVELAASAYNGGPAHVGQHLTTGQPLFAETTRYQRWVGGMWSERAVGSSATYSAWWNAGGRRLVEIAAQRAAR